MSLFRRCFSKFYGVRNSSYYGFEKMKYDAVLVLIEMIQNASKAYESQAKLFASSFCSRRPFGHLLLMACKCSFCHLGCWKDQPGRWKEDMWQDIPQAMRIGHFWVGEKGVRWKFDERSWATFLYSEATTCFWIYNSRSGMDSCDVYSITFRISASVCVWWYEGSAKHCAINLQPLWICGSFEHRRVTKETHSSMVVSLTNSWS